MLVWKYIYFSNDGFKEGGSKLTKQEIDSYLLSRLNLKDYTVKTRDLTNENNFGLEEKDGVYTITSNQTSFEFSKFEIENVSYDLKTGDVTIIGNQYYLEMGTSKKVISGKIKFDLKYNDNTDSFNLIQVTVEE